MSNLYTGTFFKTGYHGKIPSRGDFVYYGLPREFIDQWDAWLQSAITNSRNNLTDQWLDIYLTSPIWRYYLSPGLCGNHAWTGLMMPSVDKVGRYFPMTMACALPTEFNPFDLLTNHKHWFMETEEMMLGLLDEQYTDLSKFKKKAEQLTKHFANHEASTQARLGLGPLWQLPIPSIDEAASTYSELSRQMLSARFSTYSLWWSNGSERVTPSLLVSAGLPPAESFTTLMDGQWENSVWEAWPTLKIAQDKQLNTSQPSPKSPIEQPEPDIKITPLMWRSSAISHVGQIRKVNEDACLNLPDSGLWAVADGMGGHAAGDFASNMTIDVLSNLEPATTLNDFISNATDHLKFVNEQLLKQAEERSVSTIGCTVVVLLMFGQRAAFLWAGDSRIYLSRDGELQQLTKDHSYETETPFANEEMSERYANIVTRAVGATDELELDIGYLDLKAGDRFLLCSDGLNKEVTDTEIAQIIQGDDVLGVTQQLINLSLQKGARDNVSVAIVEVFSE